MIVRILASRLERLNAANHLGDDAGLAALFAETGTPPIVGVFENAINYVRVSVQN